MRATTHKSRITNHARALTLTEILVVIGIIVLVLGLAVPALSVWEGRNRELRRIFAKVALRVTRLARTAIGPLRIDGLDVGAYRRADPRELLFARERMSPDWKPKPFKAPQGQRWRERLARPRGPQRSR